MPAKKWSLKQLRDRTAFMKRNLIRGGLASEQELDEIAAPLKGDRSKDAAWAIWAEYKAIAIARAKNRDPDAAPAVDEESLEVAVAALADRPAVVELPSIKQRLVVCPASYSRIELLEGHAWWLARLEAARAILLQDATAGTYNKHVAAEICEACERPLSPGNLDETIKRIQQEMTEQRAWVYAHVVAPTPAPADKPVAWANSVRTRARHRGPVAARRAATGRSPAQRTPLP